MSDSITPMAAPPQHKGPQSADGKAIISVIPQMRVAREDVLYRFSAGTSEKHIANSIGTSRVAIESVIRDAVRAYRNQIAELKAQLIRAAMQPQWRTA